MTDQLDFVTGERVQNTLPGTITRTTRHGIDNHVKDVTVTFDDGKSKVFGADELSQITSSDAPLPVAPGDIVELIGDSDHVLKIIVLRLFGLDDDGIQYAVVREGTERPRSGRRHGMWIEAVSSLRRVDEEGTLR